MTASGGEVQLINAATTPDANATRSLVDQREREQLEIPKVDDMA